MTAKPLVLFFTPRSGSTPIAQLIGEYLRQHEGKYYAAEFLNPFFGYPQTVDGRLKFRDEEITPTSKNMIKIKLFPELEMWEFKRRWELLFQHHAELFFKFTPLEIDVQKAAWVSEHFEVLKLVRRDRMQHYLSFMVSVTSRQWYKKEGLRIAAGSLVGEQVHADAFFNFERQQKLFFESARVIYYEDFVAQGPAAFLKSLGLEKPFDESQLLLPVVQNPADKLALFRNPAELLGWFREPLK